MILRRFPTQYDALRHLHRLEHLQSSGGRRGPRESYRVGQDAQTGQWEVHLME